MRLDHLFVIAPVIATVQARCYGMTVDMYGQMMIGADAVVDESCTHDLAGYFTEGQTKYHCLQLTSNKVELWVGWKGRGGLTLDTADCKKRLMDEIKGCTLGGESVVADWYFR
jgi:hypothetical protein